MYRLNVQVTAYRDKLSLIGASSGHVTHYKNFGSSNHITETAEPKVVKFCTHVGYINSSNRVTHRQQMGRGYGHVTVLKFCRLSWGSASRGFVSDSWTTCWLGCTRLILHCVGSDFGYQTDKSASHGFVCDRWDLYFTVMAQCRLLHVLVKQSAVMVPVPIVILQWTIRAYPLVKFCVHVLLFICLLTLLCEYHIRSVLAKSDIWLIKSHYFR